MLQLAFKTMLPDKYIPTQSKLFTHEINFYSEIIPAMQKFQEMVKMPENEQIDVFLQYFGSRMSLNPHAKEADVDAILLLENAKSQNFATPNLWDRIDKDEALACLKVQISG